MCEKRRSYIYIYMPVRKSKCVCVYVCMCVRENEKRDTMYVDVRARRRSWRHGQGDMVKGDIVF